MAYFSKNYIANVNVTDWSVIRLLLVASCVLLLLDNLHTQKSLHADM